jgi:Fur family ferric uptake transcriptional regulator
VKTPSAPALEEATELFRGFLRGQRLRFTTERLECLRAALGSPAHFDADELVARLRRRGNRVSRATTYRTLSLLEQCGILRKSLLGQERHRYEAALGRGHHDHIICARCGRIEEFYDAELEALQERIAGERGFRILDHVHELFGLCRECGSGAGASGERG